MRQGKALRAWWGITALVATVWACETTRNPIGTQRDLTPPVIVLSNTQGDTQAIANGLRFTVTANDNLGLKTIRLTYSGGFISGPIDTTFVTQVKAFTVAKTVTFPSNSGAGGNVQIIARAIDGAGNFAEDTLFIFLSNIQALRVTLISPQPGALASSGSGIPVEIAASQNTGIQKIGFLVSPRTSVTDPTTPPGDSIVFTAPFADSVDYTDTLLVVPLVGTFNVVGFAEDSAGRRATTNVVIVTIQSAANDTTKPLVDHTIASRVEVDDTVTVRATDASPISWIGFRVDTSGVLLRFDTVNVAAGNLTDVTRRFSLGLGALLPNLPHAIVVRGYACDAATARNCSYTNTSTLLPAAPAPVSGLAPVQGLGAPGRAINGFIDTVIVVAGITVPLPAGGSIADAIFNGNDSTLYLTNPSLSRVEVFQVANTAFVATGIPTAGPQPWGIALWPRDTLGNYGDSIIVANSGGTELSIIDVRPGVRRLVWRQDLPDFLIETYRILTNPLRAEIIVYDVSDRPQYLATVCRTAGSPTCAADSIFAIYSTTPTVSSSSPFNGRATLRMEKLKNTLDTTQLFSHLFWELAGDSTLSSTSKDTLRIELRRGRPYNQQKVVLTACAGVMVELARFGLGDSTFVRNSGNFTHAVVGEGGNISTAFARVMGYSTLGRLLQGASTQTSCSTDAFGITGDAGENDRDAGMTPAIDVSDFISNTGVKLHSIATNFNGATNLVRADSIYYLDEGLRLKGTSPAPVGAFGMDMNYKHAFAAGSPGTPTFGGAGNPNDRIAFSARPDGNIDIWDTFFYGKIGQITVRDPIIGPLRVARNAAGTRQWLFGVTASGLVMVELPVITNPNPAQGIFGLPKP
ncbi:MAG TPA: hypothetical protein VNH63_08775 [Gemmatimonadales bacterium]|nr:hypothetical protein [Gemmatimonadales bacterium]